MGLDVLVFSFNFLIGAFVGATLLKILILKILNSPRLKLLSHYIPHGENTLMRHMPTLVFSLLGGVCGAHFSIAYAPSLLLDSALEGNLLAVLAACIIMVFCVVYIARLIKTA